MRFVIVFFIGISCLNAQDSLFVDVDNRYREDQFYGAITYNTITNTPRGVSQNEFSTGFHLGFIRDMPFNERRNWAVGLGLGVSSNSYNQNIVISETPEGTNFQINDESLGSISQNKFTRYFIDVPLELRWRTSTAKNYKFWRVYGGVKFSYLVYNSTKLQSDNSNINLSNIDAFNRFQYGLTLSAGYGTWNFHVYYGLNPIFDDTARLGNGELLDIHALKIGVMFYVL